MPDEDNLPVYVCRDSKIPFKEAWPRFEQVATQTEISNTDQHLMHILFGNVLGVTVRDLIETAIMNPPVDTRAYFRGRCIDKYPDAIAAASWDSLIVDTGADALQRIPMREPLRGTKAHVEDLLAACDDAASLVATLQG